MNESESMLASVLVAEGEPASSLIVRCEPQPVPAANDVRVRVSHAALNHLDLWIRRGMPSVPKPRITGADACGFVDLAGDAAAVTLQVRGIGTGDRVVLDPGAGCGACRACAAGETSLCSAFRVLGEHVAGTHAEFVVVPATSVHRAPAHLTDGEAAALMLAHATSWRMLFSRARVEVHERVLVWGASAGVGVAALQLCAAAGIETIATTRDAGKADALRAAGASHVIVTDADARDAGRQVVDEVMAMTGADGVDVAFDHLGQIAWEPSMRALRRGGRYVTCGVTSGANPPAAITRLFWNQLSMLGSTMASARDVAAMLAFVEHHRITPVVDRTFELADIADAHAYLERSEQVGKVVLTVSQSRG